MKNTISTKIKWYYLFFGLGIVLYHARFYKYDAVYLNSADYYCLSLFSKISEEFGVLSMTFFFFMSGFWFFYNLNSFKIGIKKMHKKIFTLIIPFFLWQFIAIAYHYNIHDYDFSISNLIYSTILDPVNGPLWYLLGVFILCGVFLLLSFFKQKIKSIFLILIFIYFILVKIGYLPNMFVFENCWWMNNLFAYIHIYTLGAIFATDFSFCILSNLYDDKRYIIVGIAFILIFIFGRKFLNSNLVSIYYMFLLSGSWLIINGGFFDKPMPKILDCYFIIYVCHSMLINRFGYFLNNVFSGVPLYGFEIIFLQIVLLLIVIVVSFLIKTISKYILSDKAYSLLTGNR